MTQNKYLAMNCALLSVGLEITPSITENHLKKWTIYMFCMDYGLSFVGSSLYTVFFKFKCVSGRQFPEEVKTLTAEII